MVNEREGGCEIKSLEHASSILQVLSAERSATLDEITEQVDIARSSVHKHLRTLSKMGMVEGGGDGYELGLELLTMGGSVRDRHPLFVHAHAEVAELADATGELAVLSVPYRTTSLTLYQVPGDDAMSTDGHLGIQQEMHCTATGKSMLAFLDADRREAVIEAAEMSGRTKNTVTTGDALRKELETIRNQKYARNDEERLEGMRAVASPIVNRNDDRVHGAIAIAAPAGRLTGELFESEYPRLIRRTAEMVEVSISYG